MFRFDLKLIFLYFKMSFDLFPIDIKKYILYKLDFILGSRYKIVCKQWNLILSNYLSNKTSYEILSPYIFTCSSEDYIYFPFFRFTEYLKFLFPTLNHEKTGKNLLINKHHRNMLRHLLFEYTKKCIDERTRLFHSIVGRRVMIDIEKEYVDSSVIKFCKGSKNNSKEDEEYESIYLEGSSGIILLSNKKNYPFIFEYVSICDDSFGEFIQDPFYDDKIYTMNTFENKGQIVWEGIGGYYLDFDFNPGWAEGSYDEIIDQFKENYFDDDKIDLFSHTHTYENQCDGLLSWKTDAHCNHIVEYIFYVTQRLFDKYGIDWKKFSFSNTDIEQLVLKST